MSDKNSGDLLGAKVTKQLNQEYELRKSAHDYNLGQISVTAIKTMTSISKPFQGSKQKQKPSNLPRPLTPPSLSPFMAEEEEEVVVEVVRNLVEEEVVSPPVALPPQVNNEVLGLLPEVPVAG